MFKNKSAIFNTIFSLILCFFSLIALLSYAAPHTAPDTHAMLLISSVVCCVLAIMFWWVWRCARANQKRAIFNSILLLLPISLHVLVMAFGAYTLVKAVYVGMSAQVHDYKEKLIYWEGIKQPVGVKLSFTLSHPTMASGLIYPPQLFLAPYRDIPDRAISSAYFSNYRKQEINRYADLRYLSKALYNKRDLGEYTQRFDASGETQFTYHLYPDIVQLVEPNRFCLEMGRQASYAVSRRVKELAALWFVAEGNNVNTDMSAALTKELNEHSTLMKNDEQWGQFFGHFHHDKQAVGIYRLCPKQTSYQRCFCK